MNFLIGLTVLGALGGALSFALKKIHLRFGVFSTRGVVIFNEMMILFVFVLSFSSPFLFPQAGIFHPIAKVWASPSARNMAAGSLEQPVSVVEVAPFNLKTHAGPVFLGIQILWACLLAFGVLLIAGNGFKFRKLIASSLTFKKFGTVEIVFSGSCSVPFSFWRPFRHWVVLPEGLAAHPRKMKMALLHELQHHRHHDTRWLYMMLALRLFCFWNPVVHWWMESVHEFQEYACDEALVGRKGISSKAYASCLLWVAETAVGRGPGLACAAGLSVTRRRHTLKRRIEKMFQERTNKTNGVVWGMSVILTAILFAGAAWASQGLVQDRRVNFSEAEALARSHSSTDGFPVVVNDLVLKELNRFLGTPDGREFMAKSLQRMDNYRSLVGSKLQEYGVPAELGAIPIIESGYQNLTQARNPSWGAGLWMFIKSTARDYGLQVDDSGDQRLNVTLETDAAMRYLVANHARFNDWTLSVLAYNAGESAVQEAIEKTGSRDPWTLVRSGLGAEPNYLPKLMAAILVMNNPGVLK